MSVTVLLGRNNEVVVTTEQVAVTWDERGCAQAMIKLTKPPKGDALDLEMGGFVALPYMPVAVALDGQIIWDGFVDELDVDEDGRLSAIRASGWTMAALGYVTAGASEPLDAVGDRLVKEARIPIRLIFNASVSITGGFAGTWADWCERVRRLTSDKGYALQVEAIPERQVIVREVQPPSRPDLLAPPRFHRKYPSARDIATRVVAQSGQDTAVAENVELAALLGCHVPRSITAASVTSLQELQSLAEAELQRADFVPSCSWQGRDAWQTVTGELLPVWSLRPGMSVFAPRIGVLQIRVVELDCTSREARVVFGRVGVERETLRRLGQAMQATVTGRSFVTWR